MFPTAHLASLMHLTLTRSAPTLILSPGGPAVHAPLPEGFVGRLLAAVRSSSPDSSIGSKASGVADTAADADVAGGVASPTRNESAEPDRAAGGEERPPGPFAVSPDTLSMEDLVREHADAVYRVALSVTRDPTLAEDASQDALIKAWQALPSFRGDAPLRNWILRITHNTAISLLRKRRDELRDPQELPEVVTTRSVEAQVSDRLAIHRFEAALDDLDSTSRSIIVLREVEGLSYDEICDVLDLAMPTVKTRLLRARRQLATALEGWRP